MSVTTPPDTYNCHTITYNFYRIWKHPRENFSHHSWRIKGYSTNDCLSPLSKHSNFPKEKTLFSLLFIFVLNATTMVGSSETTSFADQSASIMMLNIKPYQNLTLDLDSSWYTEAIKPMIECLCFSPLDQALTMAESIPLAYLSKAYSSANYSQHDGIISFKVVLTKPPLPKPLFVGY